jgi:P22 coat protein - gene protein 5
MSNRQLTADIIAKEAVMQLDNELVMSKHVFRGYENEFSDKVNGYKVGDTVSIRRPADFTVTDGATMAVQDVQEGKTTIVVEKRKHIAFKFTSQDLTLKIGEMSERVIKPAMIQLANQIDRDLMGLYDDVWNWVGTPGQAVNSFTDFAKAPERLDLGAVPQDGRVAVLSPEDHWGLLGSQTALYMQDVAKGAYRKGSLGSIAGIETFMSQNIPTLTTGTRDATTPLVKGADQVTTWAASRDTGTQDLVTDGWDNGATIEAGCVFTITGVKAVNPVTKVAQAHDQQFVVRTAVTADGSGNATLTISPPLIISGAHQTVSVVSAADLDDNAITLTAATASTGYKQNLVFHPHAFALVMVPLVSPPGAAEVSRQSYKGTSVRVIPVYDGVNDESAWRLDVLYGVKTLDARLATRLSGTA